MNSYRRGYCARTQVYFIAFVLSIVIVIVVMLEPILSLRFVSKRIGSPLPLNLRARKRADALRESTTPSIATARVLPLPSPFTAGATKSSSLVFAAAP